MFCTDDVVQWDVSSIWDVDVFKTDLDFEGSVISLNVYTYHQYCGIIFNAKKNIQLWFPGVFIKWCE